MKADSIHKMRNPPIKKKTSSAIFVNSQRNTQRNKQRKLQRVDYRNHLKKELSPEVEKDLQRKIRKERFIDNVTSVMFGVVLTFILLSLFYWVAMK